MTMSLKRILILTATILLFSTLFTGCASRAFKEAKEINTVESYDHFLLEHQESEFTDEANDLKADALFRKAKDKNTIEAYDAYVKKYPNTVYLSTIKERKEMLIFHDAKAKSTIAAYEHYLGLYPKGTHLQEVRETILQMKLKEHDLNRNMYVIADYKDLKRSDIITIDDVRYDLAITKKGMIRISNLEKSRSSFQLSLKVPHDAKVRVNGQLRERHRLWLQKGKHTVEVSKLYFYPKKVEIDLQDDDEVSIRLEKIPFLINGTILWSEKSSTVLDHIKFGDIRFVRGNCQLGEKNLLWSIERVSKRVADAEKAQDHCSGLSVKNSYISVDKFRLPTGDELKSFYASQEALKVQPANKHRVRCVAEIDMLDMRIINDYVQRTTVIESIAKTHQESYTAYISRAKENKNEIFLKKLEEIMGLVYGRPIVVSADYDKKSEQFTILLRAQSSEYKMTLKTPVEQKYAKRFKALLMEPTFSPHIEIDIVDNKLKASRLLVEGEAFKPVYNPEYKKQIRSTQRLESYMIQK